MGLKFLYRLVDWYLNHVIRNCSKCVEKMLQNCALSLGFTRETLWHAPTNGIICNLLFMVRLGDTEEFGCRSLSSFLHDWGSAWTSYVTEAVLGHLTWLRQCLDILRDWGSAWTSYVTEAVLGHLTWLRQCLDILRNWGRAWTSGLTYSKNTGVFFLFF